MKFNSLTQIKFYGKTFTSKVWKTLRKTSLIESILVNSQSYSLQTAALLRTDFTKYSLRNMSQKLAFLKRIFWEKNLWHTKSPQFCQKRSSVLTFLTVENLDEVKGKLSGSFFSPKSQI